MLSGSLEYRLDGRPPVTLEAGDVLFIPDGAVHAARNVGRASASELATYVVRKGRAAAHSGRVNHRALDLRDLVCKKEHRHDD